MEKGHLATSNLSVILIVLDMWFGDSNWGTRNSIGRFFLDCWNVKRNGDVKWGTFAVGLFEGKCYCRFNKIKNKFEKPKSSGSCTTTPCRTFNKLFLSTSVNFAWILQWWSQTNILIQDFSEGGHQPIFSPIFTKKAGKMRNFESRETDEFLMEHTNAKTTMHIH